MAMVAAVAQTSRHESWALACELLLIVAMREHLWPHLPAHLQGMASKGLGAALVLVLLLMVYRHAPKSRALVVVLLLAAWYSTQTLICSAAYMVEPWTVPPGQGICSARIGFDLGALALVAVAATAMYLSSLTGGSNRDNP
jgi:hypothetical protein